jgi:putrescine transport system permease protein
MNGRSWFRSISLTLGFAFLYIPVVSLVVYSFNRSKLVTVWGGFSTKWYGELIRNEQILGAAWLSLKIATISATLAVVLGTLAGMVLARFGPFKGRTLLSGLTTAPLVMPEVITGLSLLLLFVTMEQLIGWPAGRGMTTIVISHITFTMAFVTIIVQSRLVQLDDSLEEAAMDLGARPFKVFFLITLPIIAARPRHHEFRSRSWLQHAADGDLFESTPWCQSGHQCAGYDPRRGCCDRRDHGGHLDVPAAEDS